MISIKHLDLCRDPHSKCESKSLSVRIRITPHSIRYRYPITCDPVEKVKAEHLQDTPPSCTACRTRASATSHSQKNYRLKAPELAQVSLSLSEQDDRFQVPYEGIKTPCGSARVPKCASLDRYSMVPSKGIKTPCGSARHCACA